MVKSESSTLPTNDSSNIFHGRILHVVHSIAASGFYNIPTSSLKEAVYKEGTLTRKNELDEGARRVSMT